MFGSIIKKNRRGGHGNEFYDTDLLVSRYHQGGKSKGDALCIRLSEKLVKQARYMKGDFLDVQWDDGDKYGLICRVSDPTVGRMLCHNNNRSKCMTLKFTPADDAIFEQMGLVGDVRNRAADAVQIDDRGILFRLP